MTDICTLKRKLERELSTLERLDAVLGVYERGESDDSLHPKKLKKLYRSMTVSEAKYARLLEQISRIQSLTAIERMKKI